MGSERACVRSVGPRHYYSWVMAMLLNQHNLQVHTYPRTIFSVSNFTMAGYSCMPDKVSSSWNLPCFPVPQVTGFIVPPNAVS
jgi:hypothetical protein